MLELVSALAAADPDIAHVLRAEARRQHGTLEMIASENFVSTAVLAAMGSVLTNKYAEGYPGKRYYGGCEEVDVAENLARDRVKALFSAEHANVQPHSGSQANQIAYFSFLKPGDTIMGLSLSHGGHLTHGHPVNFSGMFFKVVPYEVSRDTKMLDYDAIREQALRERPKMLVAGASAYARTWDFARLRAICDEAGCLLMVDMAHIAGLVAAGLHPSPVPHADVVTSTTHKTLRGPRGGFVLAPARNAEVVDKITFPGMQGGPFMHIIAAKAVCFKEAATPEFALYQQQVVKNAGRLAAALTGAGFRIVSGGTDNHIVLVDVFSKGITGKVAEAALGQAGITVNKNAIPFDQNPPMVASGVRLGTPAVTTRGMGEPEMDLIAEYISRVLAEPDHVKTLAIVKAEIEALCRKFPLYPERLA